MNNVDFVLKQFLKSTLVPLSVLYVLASLPLALASPKESPNITWEAEVNAGILNDSNVALDELDQNSTQGDTATQWRTKVGSKVQISDRVELKISASLSDKSFQDFDQFDLRTSLLTLQSSYDFSAFKLGGGIRSISTDLASNSFLSSQQLYVFATHRLNKQWFFRGELNFADKEFDQQSNRDTSREKIGIDAYYFLDDTKKYWSYGFSFGDEQSDTNNDQFSRNNGTLKIKYSQLMPVFGRDIRVDARLRYQSRDYDAVDPRIGEVRDDNRYRAAISAKIPITGNWFMLGEYEFSDYSSNLPSADYSQNLFSIKVGWALD
jgi:hypothetical protein